MCSSNIPSFPGNNAFPAWLQQLHRLTPGDSDNVEPDDVVIADIAGQALDIFLHDPESTHNNGIGNTNIHSHIHSHPAMHTTKTNSKTLNSLNMSPSFLFLSSVMVGDGLEA